MTKKKQDRTPEPEIAEEPKPYSTSKWNGLDNYECSECSFSSLHENVILEHYVKTHLPPPEPPKPVIIPIYDRFGNRQN